MKVKSLFGLAGLCSGCGAAVDLQTGAGVRDEGTRTEAGTGTGRETGTEAETETGAGVGMDVVGVVGEEGVCWRIQDLKGLGASSVCADLCLIRTGGEGCRGELLDDDDACTGEGGVLYFDGWDVVGVLLPLPATLLFSPASRAGDDLCTALSGRAPLLPDAEAGVGADPRPLDSRGVSGVEVGMVELELTALVALPMPIPIQLLSTSIVVRAGVGVGVGVAVGVVAVVWGGLGEAIHGTGPAGDATVLAWLHAVRGEAVMLMLTSPSPCSSPSLCTCSSVPPSLFPPHLRLFSFSIARSGSHCTSRIPCKTPPTFSDWFPLSGITISAVFTGPVSEIFKGCLEYVSCSVLSLFCKLSTLTANCFCHASGEDLCIACRLMLAFPGLLLLLLTGSTVASTWFPVTFWCILSKLGGDIDSVKNDFLCLCGLWAGRGNNELELLLSSSSSIWLAPDILENMVLPPVLLLLDLILNDDVA
jgi:hypothetical protein